MMPYIEHPATQGETVSIVRWIKYRLGVWMQRKGYDWEDTALHPDNVICPECGQRKQPDEVCDHIPF